MELGAWWPPRARGGLRERKIYELPHHQPTYLEVPIEVVAQLILPLGLTVGLAHQHEERRRLEGHPV